LLYFGDVEAEQFHGEPNLKTSLDGFGWRSSCHFGERAPDCASPVSPAKRNNFLLALTLPEQFNVIVGKNKQNGH
jgi:hypothetical protein